MIWLESVAGLAAGFNESSPSRVFEYGDSSQVESFYVNALELSRVELFEIATRVDSSPSIWLDSLQLCLLRMTKAGY